MDTGKALPADRVRRPGAGRKRNIDKDPDLLLELDDLVSPETRGDPMSPLGGTLKSIYALAAALRAKGFSIRATPVGELLHQTGYSLQAAAKQKEGAQHADRDAQFCCINHTAVAFMADDPLVISVDAKKKELIGPYANAHRMAAPGQAGRGQGA